METKIEQTEQHETPTNSKELFHSGGAVSISEAARLTGKSRGTLYRHNKAGKLSFTRDLDGNPEVQIAELMRVYKSIKLPKADTETLKIEQDETVQDRTAETLEIEQVEQHETPSIEQKEQRETPAKGAMALVDTLRRLEAVQRQLSSEKKLRESEQALVDTRIAEIKEGYEARIDDLKDNVKSWQDQAKSSQRLLEHHETKQVQKGRGLLARIFGK